MPLQLLRPLQTPQAGHPQATARRSAHLQHSPPPTHPPCDAVPIWVRPSGGSDIQPSSGPNRSLTGRGGSYSRPPVNGWVGGRVAKEGREGGRVSWQAGR